jgi:ribonuclease Z
MHLCCIAELIVLISREKQFKLELQNICSSSGAAWRKVAQSGKTRNDATSRCFSIMRYLRTSGQAKNLFTLFKSNFNTVLANLIIPRFFNNFNSSTNPSRMSTENKSVDDAHDYDHATVPLVTHSDYKCKYVDNNATEIASPAARINKLIFLGTGSAVPSPENRNTSSCAIQLSNGSHILIDAGEATQHQIMRSNTVYMNKIDAILITHAHLDHCAGIFGLLCTMATHGRTEPVVIIAPTALKTMINTVLLLGGGFYSFDIQYCLLPDQHGSGNISLQNNSSKYIDLGVLPAGIHCAAISLDHRITAYGYILTEPFKAGQLDAKKAMELGLKGKQLGQLKSGKAITLEDGRIVKSSDCVGPPVAGRKLAILQDTCNTDHAAEKLTNVDILIHEATYHAELQQKAISHGHSTAEMAGKFAAKVSAKNLILTHFSMRYSKGELQQQQLINEAKNAVQESGSDCSVFAAEDFLAFDSTAAQFKQIGYDKKQ